MGWPECAQRILWSLADIWEKLLGRRIDVDTQAELRPLAWPSSWCWALCELNFCLMSADPCGLS